MSVDLTEIVDEVARKVWADSGDVVAYDDLSPATKVKLKQHVLPIIHQTAELVERTVRRDARVRIDLVPRANLDGTTVYLEDVLSAVGR